MQQIIIKLQFLIKICDFFIKNNNFYKLYIKYIKYVNI
jgi:hypothetical protein